MKTKFLDQRTGQYVMANVNPETGIRYGVASLNNLADWVFDEFFYHGTNVSYEKALEEFKKDVLKRAMSVSDEEIQRFSDEYQGEEECYTLERDGLKLGLSYLGGAPLVWVYESPFTTYARECSPCVPNAGDLDNQDESGVQCYTLPPEWFNND